jgi:hypothetical protein
MPRYTPYRPSDETEPAWRSEPATEKLLAALERRGIEIPYDCTKGEASDLLDRPTPKQRKLLERHGLWEEGMTFAEARAAIDDLMGRRGW